MDPTPLRLGLVAGSRQLASWQLMVVAALEAAGMEVVAAEGWPSGGSARAIDVELNLGTTADRPGRTDARFGRWQFVVGGDPSLDPYQAVSLAARCGADSVEVALERDGAALRRGVFGLEHHAVRASVAAAVACFTQWPAWCAAALADGRDAPFGADPTERPRSPAVAGAFGSPRRAIRAARALARKALWAEVWTVGVAEGSAEALVAGGLPPSLAWLPERGARGVRALWAPRGLAADPFLYRAEGRDRCLFEVLDHGEGRGWIAEVDLDGGRLVPAPREVFRNGWHWSYPYIFEEDGSTYCIPETADAGVTTLHRLTPHGFEPVASLLPGLAVLDPSIVRHDDRYWLFCTRRDGPLLNTALHLFVADRLEGPYHPHPDNPVKLDIGSARPAGTVFRVGDTLYRPGQDCRGDYGAALVLHRVDELSEQRFRETAVARLCPVAPYPAGLHTLAIGHGRLAIDAKRSAFSPPLLARRMAQLVRRRSR